MAKHKNPYWLKVGDLLCWDGWHTDKPKQRLFFALITKVNERSVVLHFPNPAQARACRLEKKVYFKDDLRKVRVDKLVLACAVGNVFNRANIASNGAYSEELYFIGSTPDEKQSP